MNTKFGNRNSSVSTWVQVLMVIGLGFLLSACAQVGSFQNSTLPNSVKVEIRDERMLGSWTLFTFDDGGTCSGRKLVASSSTVKSLDIRVDAGKRHSYMMFQHYGTYTCRIAMSFDTVAGNIYSVRLASDSQKCYMGTYNTTRSIAGVRERTSLRRIIKTGFTEASSWCEPADSTLVGMPIESSATPSESGDQRGGSERQRSETTLDDLKDLLPKR